MKPEDFGDFRDLITDCLAFYRRDVSAFTLDVWWQACQPFDMGQVKSALTAHAMDPEAGKFPPMPGDLVRKLQGTHTERAMLAWGKVHDAMSSVGAYRSVVFDDPAIHATIEDLGGWVKVVRTELKDMGYLQHTFCEICKTYTARGHFPYPPMLGGDADASWKWESYGLKPPKLAVVGDRETAYRVFQGGSKGGKTPILVDSTVRLAIGPVCP